MLLTIGKFAIIAALAFAGGVLLGRQHPPPSARQKQLNAAITKLTKDYPSDTSTPAPVCGKPTDEVKAAIRAALDEPTAGPWASSDGLDATYVAVVTSKTDSPALFSYQPGEPEDVRAVNAAARQATILPPGEPSGLGNEAVDCVTP